MCPQQAYPGRCPGLLCRPPSGDREHLWWLAPCSRRGHVQGPAPDGLDWEEDLGGLDGGGGRGLQVVLAEGPLDAGVPHDESDERGRRGNQVTTAQLVGFESIRPRIEVDEPARAAEVDAELLREAD